MAKNMQNEIETGLIHGLDNEIESCGAGVGEGAEIIPRGAPYNHYRRNL